VSAASVGVSTAPDVSDSARSTEHCRDRRTSARIARRTGHIVHQASTASRPSRRAVTSQLVEPAIPGPTPTATVGRPNTIVPFIRVMHTASLVTPTLTVTP